MDFQPFPSPVSAGELFLNVFSSRFTVWEDPGSEGWRQERGFFVWLPRVAVTAY